ncbi:hypothetical protein KP509_29G051900 [Ceratopteris richardii]|uniref:Uncharacterized protein n=1 Tax=Ceratopteris richardii TaxID=49495 RepID=A0A8T2R7X1_CERRI|nr:hypothetical protein KP509_29G051900 [Ceratopteris richardii]
MGRRKKQNDETDRDHYVGRRVEKNFDGFGKYSGSVVAYNAARKFYKIVYEDGDREELELHELEPILVSLTDSAYPSDKGVKHSRKKDDPAADEPDSKRPKRDLSNKSETPITRVSDSGGSARITRKQLSLHRASSHHSDHYNDAEGTPNAEADVQSGDVVQIENDRQCSSLQSSKRKRLREDQECISDPPSVRSTRTSRQSVRCGSVKSQNLSQAFKVTLDGDASSDNVDDSYVDECDEMSSSDVDSMRSGLPGLPEKQCLPPLVPLPSSSASFPLPEDLVAEAFAVYSFLRSFSHALFLSPFSFDDFVSALTAEIANNLIDSIHLILLQALRRHLQRLSKDDCLRSKECLRRLDWNLLDNITWPSFLIVFLSAEEFSKSFGQRISFLEVLNTEYYRASAKTKLAVLSFLCDHVLDTEEIRAVLDAREVESSTNYGQKDGRDSIGKSAEQQSSAIREHRRKKTSTDSMQEITTASVEISSVQSKSAQEEISPDWNSDECVLCGMNGNLICCDGCPAAYHTRCVGISRTVLPPGEWFCPECAVERYGGEQSRSLKGLEGCHSLGVDQYGRSFLATCGHLLVLSPISSTQFNFNYYNKGDILKVLQVLEGQDQLYADISSSIRQYWSIPSEQSIVTGNSQVMLENGDISNDGQVNTEQCGHFIREPVEQGAKKVNVEHRDTSKIGACEIPLVSESEKSPIKVLACTQVLESTVGSEAFVGHSAGADLTFESENPQQKASNLPDSVSISNVPKGKPIICEATACQLSLKSSCASNAFKSLEGSCVQKVEEMITGFPPPQNQHMGSQCIVQDPYLVQKVLERDSKGRFSNSLSRDHSQSDMIHKSVPQESLQADCLLRISSYVNHYVYGDAAATAAANLALMAINEVDFTEKEARKLRRTGTTIAEQMNAFSKAPARFCWPSSRKKLMEAPKDRCGWCFSCMQCMKRGCLLNQVSIQLAAGAARVSGGIRPSKYGHGHLPAVTGYILYLEDVLHSFLIGPWENTMFRKQWRKKLEQAMSVHDVKAALLDIGANLRTVVLTEDWSTCLEDAPIVSEAGSGTSHLDDSLSKKASAKKSSRRSGVSRQGFPRNSDTFFLGNVQWARRGKLAHRVVGWATLSSEIARKVARQGGLKNIPGITYVECEQVPRRSKQTAWHARVQAAQSVAELAVQVRYLDCMLRWDELSAKSESHSAKVCEDDDRHNEIILGVHARTVKDDVTMYLIDSALVSRQIVRQNASAQGLSQNCKAQQIWIEERQVPLHLLREFEEKERLTKQSRVPKISSVQKYLTRLKRAPKKDTFRFLWERAGFSTIARLVLSINCKSCSLKMSTSLATLCHLCGGPFHKDCAVASYSIEGEIMYTCHDCLNQLVVQSSSSPNTVKANTPLCSPSQKTDSMQAAMNLLSYQRRVITSHSHPQPLQKLSVRSSKTSIAASQGKEDVKRVGEAVVTVSPDVRKVLEKSAFEGIYWRKNGASSRMCFERNMLFPSQEGAICEDVPKCYLCKLEYGGDLIYVKCEYCPLWFHGDSLGVNSSNYEEVIGFKCNRCRKKAVPLCPYGNKARIQRRANSSPRLSSISLQAVGASGKLYGEAYTTKRSPLPIFSPVIESKPPQEVALSAKLSATIVNGAKLTSMHWSENHFKDFHHPSLKRSEPLDEGLPAKCTGSDDQQPECDSQSESEKFQQLVEESKTSVDIQPLQDGHTQSSPSDEKSIKSEPLDEISEMHDAADCVSEDGQRLFAGEGLLAHDDAVEDNSMNGESSAQPTLSFMELLSSEDDRVEEIAEVAMDFTSTDGFDVFDLDTLLENHGSWPPDSEVEPTAGGQVGNCDTRLRIQSSGEPMGATDKVCLICNDSSQPLDLQCAECGAPVHQECLDAGRARNGIWTDQGWSCGFCKAGSAQSEG